MYLGLHLVQSLVLFECLETILENKQNSKMYLCFRVTSLEQLSVAEFSGEKVTPKVHDNGHKNVLAIWFDLVSNIKI